VALGIEMICLRICLFGGRGDKLALDEVRKTEGMSWGSHILHKHFTACFEVAEVPGCEVSEWIYDHVESAEGDAFDLVRGIRYPGLETRTYFRDLPTKFTTYLDFWTSR